MIKFLPRSFFSTFISSPPPLISVSEAYHNFSQKTSFFLDIRDPKAFLQSHIPNSQNLNEIFSYLGTSDLEGIKTMTSTFEKLFRKVGITGNEHIITYEECLKTRFGASCRGYFLLRLLGHNNVSVLNGGYEAWLKAKYPTTSEMNMIKPSSFNSNYKEEIYASKGDVLAVVQGEKKGALLDVRSLDEWNGETSSPYGKDFAPRKGRIPKAIHVLWTDFMVVEEGGSFIKEAKEVERICEGKGLRKEEEIIVYCFKGARASNSLIALERAGYKVRNYFASWNEWSRDFSLPIEN